MFDRITRYPIYITLPLLCYFWYLFYSYLVDPNYITSFLVVNNVIHEWWHMAISWAWVDFITAISWTVAQLGVPIFIMVWLYWHRDYFLYYLWYAILWINFFQISQYAWDAIEMKIPMVELFWEAKYWHDWNYILNAYWIIWYPDIVSNVFYALAIICFLVCFVFNWITVFNRLKHIWF
jgi:hypothetical protein